MVKKIVVLSIVTVLIVFVAIGIGSVVVPPKDIIRIVFNQLFGVALPTHIDESTVAIIWEMRIPRVLMAFVVGALLSLSGVVIQAVLRNPLASSYTLGVSSGASFGVAIVVFLGVSSSALGLLFMPFVGFIFAILSIFAVILLSSKFDPRLENNTVILVGLIFSLFFSSVISLIATFNYESVKQLYAWQFGSFASTSWSEVVLLTVLLIIISVVTYTYSREIDILTFGDEQSNIVGVNARKTKVILLFLAAAMTGSAIAFVGIIGFVDLIIPHVVRKIFGAAHKIVIPMTILIGGSFMVICDLLARTLIDTQEIPVGVITSLIGAPFFIYVYFSKRGVR